MACALRSDRAGGPIETSQGQSDRATLNSEVAGGLFCRVAADHSENHVPAQANAVTSKWMGVSLRGAIQGEPGFTSLKPLVKVHCASEYADRSMRRR
jgi:hypothetical protein